MHAIERQVARVGLAAIALTAMVAAAPAQELSDADKAISNVVTIGDPVEAPTAWLGEAPHFVMVGAYKDYTFSINLRDPLPEGVKIEGKREFRKNDAGGLDYIDFEIAVELITNGIERGIELEFENANFAAQPIPSAYALQGEEFPAGLFSNMELQIEWEWVEKSVVVNEEDLYSDGSLTVSAESGPTAPDGTIPTGMIGGFATGTLDGKTVAISFSAPVVEAEIDD